MVQRLFFDIIKQRDHKYAAPPPQKQFCVFLATAPTDVLTAGTAEIQKTKFMGKVLHIYGKNEGVAPLRELLYMIFLFSEWSVLFL